MIFNFDLQIDEAWKVTQNYKERVQLSCDDRSVIRWTQQYWSYWTWQRSICLRIEKLRDDDENYYKYIFKNKFLDEVDNRPMKRL